MTPRSVWPNGNQEDAPVPHDTPRDRRPIRERLADFYTDVEIARMVVTPQEELGDRTPGELIISGRAEEVHALIDRLHDTLFKTERV